MNQGFVVWLTGLSGAGKSTITTLLNERALDVPLTEQALSDARHFLRDLKDRVQALPARD